MDNIPPDIAEKLNDPVRQANREKFELELEFVQSLANPFYLQSLAQQNVLADPAFIRYLEYLLYWKEREYARFIVYPHALHHLDLLQNQEFRDALKIGDTAPWLHQKQFDHWRTWRAGPSTNSAENGNGVGNGNGNGNGNGDAVDG